MKAKLIHHQKLPDWGARSKMYFGISFNFSSDFFHKTSSRGMVGTTNNPTPKHLRIYESQQLDLRAILFFKMEGLGYTKQQCLGEWEQVVWSATKEATDYFSREYKGQTNPFVPYCEKAISVCSVAGEIGISEMRRIVSLKTGKEGLKFFACPPNGQFEFKADKIKRNVPARLRYLLIQNQPWCSCCGQKSPNVELCVDHIISLKNGGSNDIENLQVLCEPCNLGKGAL